MLAIDEPTNHTDLPSVECLKTALADCQCALLLVSHDMRFLGRLTTTRWEIRPDEEDADAAHMLVSVRETP